MSDAKKLHSAGYSNLAKAGFSVPSGMQFKSQYEAASTSRRMGSWGATTTGPNAGAYELSTLRARSRHITANNPYARSALNSYVSNMVGTGIKPRWTIDNESLKEALQELWEDWVVEADFHGRMSFYGLLEQICATEFQSGEVFIQLMSRPMSSDLAVPFQLKVIEPDYCDAADNRRISPNRIVMNGIEFNNSGERKRYHLYINHPSDYYYTKISSGEKIAVPAENILHIFQADRPGQVRGIPIVSAVLTKLHELDAYQDAELLRKKTSAMFAAFVKKEAGVPNPLSGGIGDTSDGETNSSDIPLIGLEPGIIQYLNSGEDVVFSEPADVGATTKDWMDAELHAIASGWGITYEQLTGDLRQVNYTSIRAGLIEFRRRTEMKQANVLIHQACRPVMNKFIDHVFLSGALALPDFTNNPRQYKRVKWYTHGWDFVDPVKDQTGIQLGIKGGWDTREDAAARRGKDVEKIDKTNAEDLERADKLGLAYDSDPRPAQNPFNENPEQQDMFASGEQEDEDEDKDQDEDQEEQDEKKAANS